MDYVGLLLFWQYPASVMATPWVKHLTEDQMCKPSGNQETATIEIYVCIGAFANGSPNFG